MKRKRTHSVWELVYPLNLRFFILVLVLGGRWFRLRLLVAVTITSGFAGFTAGTVRVLTRTLDDSKPKGSSIPQRIGEGGSSASCLESHLSLGLFDLVQSAWFMRHRHTHINMNRTNQMTVDRQTRAFTRRQHPPLPILHFILESPFLKIFLLPLIPLALRLGIDPSPAAPRASCPFAFPTNDRTARSSTPS
ncbi:hypothetical protein CPB84DRAFT_1784350 [Gymnopilus junonius]|uniref:Uncharacterized protein n=1 Tax=Gymnopilus junonius TaxID=109634 RepID=A0A9P5NLJ2_GYMJU|nr:hypothetical protein CPB84DRAFT_1784350 [Gymnopilus junonius]